MAPNFCFFYAHLHLQSALTRRHVIGLPDIVNSESIKLASYVCLVPPNQKTNAASIIRFRVYNVHRKTTVPHFRLVRQLRKQSRILKGGHLHTLCSGQIAFYYGPGKKINELRRTGWHEERFSPFIFSPPNIISYQTDGRYANLCLDAPQLQNLRCAFLFFFRPDRQELKKNWIGCISFPPSNIHNFIRRRTNAKYGAEDQPIAKSQTFNLMTLASKVLQLRSSDRRTSRHRHTQLLQRRIGINLCRRTSRHVSHGNSQLRSRLRWARKITSFPASSL